MIISSLAVVTLLIATPQAVRPAARVAVPSGCQVAPVRMPQDHAGERPSSRRRVVAVFGLAVLVVAVVIGVAPAAAVMGIGWWVQRQSMRHGRDAARRRLRRELIEAAELLAIGLRNGRLAMAMCRSIPHWLDGEVALALGRVAQRHDRGIPVAEALAAGIEPLGDDAVTLAAVIAASSIDGAAVVPALVDYADDLRTVVQLEIETAAQQLPVRMLGPLVVCVLPAFLVLTVVPLVIESLFVLVR